MMNLQAFENLEDIPKLLNYLEQIHTRLEKLENDLVPKLDLSKRAGVKKYLNVSDSTLHLMMKDGRLKQGIHYTKNLNGNRVKIKFIESAIVNFKEKK
ncbi:hypothetical protein [Halarcobacter sp.]|uniref:hypothetical protein n=1 Tax=Halarcobacter sp. TaxID=2321133 RepID=UPI0029F5B56C|nr:hypothetical protein [Halarcobacter sp.]